MSRLSTLHPYPAMVPDKLATNLCEKYVKPNDRVLDPFCGTGRIIIAASEVGAFSIGIDVNPLAILIAEAKTKNIIPESLLEIIQELRYGEEENLSHNFYNLEFGRKVDWFSTKANFELQSIISWINKKRFNEPELSLLAVILSATVRDVSYCRNKQWKLHRMTLIEREGFYLSPWIVVKKRLQAVYQELLSLDQLKGLCRVTTGDSKNLYNILKNMGENKKFDVVMTSPPYGDSKTTVQYGAMSGLSLGVLRHLKGLNFSEINGNAIDLLGLGGNGYLKSSKEPWILNDKSIWYGSKTNPSAKRVNSYLVDVDICVQQISKILKRGGCAIFVVARRLTGGWRLHIDKFLIESFHKHGLLLEKKEKRKIKNKVTPPKINRSGRKVTTHDSKSYISTMRDEYILVFRKI